MAIQGVPIGHMRLYSHMRPGLQAGVYSVELDQRFAVSDDTPADDADDIGAVGGVTKNIEVTAPRFGMPTTEVHSVFPPHNSVGPFQDSLPHIALKRRTLPWERSGDEVDPDKPWLALVVLSDGEANFLRNASVKDVLPSRFHGGVSDDAVCDAIELSTTTISKVFPAEEELPYLFHVRQLNVNDTENAGNDDDGFMAVVMANRLPRAGTNYGVYLISIEDRFDELPDDPGNSTPNIGDRSVYDIGLADLPAYSYSAGAAGARVDLSSSAQPTRKTGAGTRRSSTTAPLSSTSGGSETRANAWHAAGTGSEAAAAAGFAESTSHGAMTVINDVDIAALETDVLEVSDVILVRYPVLAHWQFTCTDGQDFRTLMVNLDVAMLGNQAATGASADPPQVTTTGHVRIDNLTRGGERVRAWYRGPFTSRQVKRRERTVPFHSADQARTIGGDFIENLGEAAAFEVGRMLALADPSFLQELLRGRRDGFRRLTTATQVSDAGFGDLLTDDAGALGIGRILTTGLLVGLADNDLAGLGPRIDPTAGLTLRDDDAEVIAAGLGTSVERVRVAMGVGRELTVPGAKVGSAPQAEVTSFEQLVATADTELSHLATELNRKVETIAADASPERLRRRDG